MIKMTLYWQCKPFWAFSCNINCSGLVTIPWLLALDSHTDTCVPICTWKLRHGPFWEDKHHHLRLPSELTPHSNEALAPWTVLSEQPCDFFEHWMTPQACHLEGTGHLDYCTSTPCNFLLAIFPYIFIYFFCLFCFCIHYNKLIHLEAICLILLVIWLKDKRIGPSWGKCNPRD